MLMDNNMDNLIINNLKSLSIDMINNAKSGHPGIALGATKIIYTLYNNSIIVTINCEVFLKN